MFYLFFLLSLPAELDVFSLITVSDPKTLEFITDDRRTFEVVRWV